MKKVVIITGGSEGLGKAIAERLVKRYRIIILARDRKKLAEAAKKLDCKFLVCDITNEKQVKKAVGDIIKKFGRIDCLVNNAGLFITGFLEDNDPNKIREVVEVNVLGTILMTKAVLPFMKKENSGLIINISSQAGISARSERSVYNASKWAITGFTNPINF